MFLMLHSTQTSKQHFKKHNVLPEVFLNSVSVGLKQNKLMKHSIFHCRQCCFPALGSWWQAAHMKNTLFIFLKFVYFFENFIHMYSIYIICTPPSMTSISSLDWHFLNLQPFLLQLFCYMCACRKKSRQTDRQSVI